VLLSVHPVRRSQCSASTHTAATIRMHAEERPPTPPRRCCSPLSRTDTAPTAALLAWRRHSTRATRAADHLSQPAGVRSQDSALCERRRVSCRRHRKPSASCHINEAFPCMANVKPHTWMPRWS
jgi:hypothetical protein